MQHNRTITIPIPISSDNPSSERPPFIEMIRAEARGYPDLIKKATQSQQRAKVYPDPDETQNVFTLFTGNRWIELGEREPDPKMLFGEFWHQNELCILFADTNAGKSVLAVQIGNSITRRQPIAPFAVQAKIPLYFMLISSSRPSNSIFAIAMLPVDMNFQIAFTVPSLIRKKKCRPTQKPTTNTS
jgi:hypothetical protein